MTYCSQQTGSLFVNDRSAHTDVRTACILISSASLKKQVLPTERKMARLHTNSRSFSQDDCIAVHHSEVKCVSPDRLCMVTSIAVSDVGNSMPVKQGLRMLSKIFTAESASLIRTSHSSLAINSLRRSSNILMIRRVYL
jgi:hypothetical protein